MTTPEITHKAFKEFCKHYTNVRNYRGNENAFHWQCGFNYQNMSFKIGDGENYQPCTKKICPIRYWDDYCKQRDGHFEMLSS